MKVKKILLLLFIAFTSYACEEKKQDVSESSTNVIENTLVTTSVEKKLAKYSVINKIKSETGNKAQILIYAFLDKDLNTKNEIENSLNDIYEKNKNETGYKEFSKPTVVGAYLFSSKKLAQQNKSAWTGMLIKGPNDTEPRVMVNDLKLKSQNGLKDNKKSQDEIVLDALNKSLSKRGLELCSFNKRLSDIELDCIHKADKRYPDFGVKHMTYTDKLTEIEMGKLQKKYHLDHNIFTKISVFASVYCK